MLLGFQMHMYLFLNNYNVKKGTKFKATPSQRENNHCQFGYSYIIPLQINVYKWNSNSGFNLAHRFFTVPYIYYALY